MMLRKLMGIVLAAAMLFAVAGTASANLFMPLQSTLTYKLGALAPINTKGSYRFNGWATLTNNGGLHNLSDQQGIWVTVGNDAGTSLFTGVTLITNLALTVVNLPGNFTASYSAINPVGGNLTGSNQTSLSGTLCPGGCLGGLEGFSGQTVVWVGGTGLPFNANIIGVGGVGTLSLPPFGKITATGGPFVTGKARITGITTNVISLPNRVPAVSGVGLTLSPLPTEEVKTFTANGGFITSNPGQPLKVVHTVTIAGTNNLASTASDGTVTLVSPIRVNAGVFGVGVLPGMMRKTFTFVPEPGTMLLLASGAAGLILIGRKRMRK